LFRAALVLMLAGAGLMTAGALEREPAVIYAGTAHVAAAIALVFLELLFVGRR
jgi:hypothetical protein